MKKYIKQAGGIVLNAASQILLVETSAQSWSFPKGSINESEDLLATAKREIREETGISNLNLIKKLGSIERPGFTKDNIKAPTVTKHITYFLFTTDQQNLDIDDEGTISAEWISIEKVVDHLTYKQDKDFFANQLTFVNSLIIS